MLKHLDEKKNYPGHNILSNIFFTLTCFLFAENICLTTKLCVLIKQKPYENYLCRLKNYFITNNCNKK